MTRSEKIEMWNEFLTNPDESICLKVIKSLTESNFLFCSSLLHILQECHEIKELKSRIEILIKDFILQDI